MARAYRHPSFEQAVREVVETLTNLSFAPATPVRRSGTVGVDVHHCPFSVDPKDPDGAVVCGFHQGLIRGLAETASGQDIGVRLRPFIAPGLCRVELSTPKKRPPAVAAEQ
jgi:predicted ArsR family transcriptional regulator